MLLWKLYPRAEHAGLNKDENVNSEVFSITQAQKTFYSEIG